MIMMMMMIIIIIIIIIERQNGKDGGRRHFALGRTKESNHRVSSWRLDGKMDASIRRVLLIEKVQTNTAHTDTHRRARSGRRNIRRRNPTQNAFNEKSQK